MSKYLEERIEIPNLEYKLSEFKLRSGNLKETN